MSNEIAGNEKSVYQRREALTPTAKAFVNKLLAFGAFWDFSDAAVVGGWKQDGLDMYADWVDASRPPPSGFWRIVFELMQKHEEACAAADYRGEIRPSSLP